MRKLRRKKKIRLLKIDREELCDNFIRNAVLILKLY